MIDCQGNEFNVSQLPKATASGTADDRRPLFLGLTTDHQAVVMAAEGQIINRQAALVADAFPIYSYRDRHTGLVWFVSDGDKKTGKDTLNCGDHGSPVFIVRNTDSDAAPAELVRMICPGHGHHVVTFTAPSSRFPETPRRAFVSNLIDGSIAIVANDPEDTANFLKIIDTINLFEAGKEDGNEMVVPNNSFPHGQEYSPVTGMLYCLSNGYGTVAVINPSTGAIEDRIELKVSSNLLLSPNGRFLIGKGADRKTDAEHVMGRLSVIDVEQRKVVTIVDLPDIYPSVYRFSPDGTRLYVTTAATGKDVQHDNLNIDTLFVYDASALPELKLLREVKVGKADCGRRPLAFFAADGEPSRVFVPNPTDATVSILDGAQDEVLATLSIGEQASNDVNFSFWQGDIYGA